MTSVQNSEARAQLKSLKRDSMQIQLGWEDQDIIKEFRCPFMMKLSVSRASLRLRTIKANPLTSVLINGEAMKPANPNHLETLMISLVEWTPKATIKRDLTTAMMRKKTRRRKKST